MVMACRPFLGGGDGPGAGPGTGDGPTTSSVIGSNGAYSSRFYVHHTPRDEHENNCMERETACRWTASWAGNPRPEYFTHDAKCFWVCDNKEN